MYNQSMVKKMKSLEELTERIKDLLPQLQRQFHVRTIELFGSYVRGSERPDSDLDILVTFDQTPSLFTFIGLENLLSDELGVKAGLVMKESLKPAIGKRILEEARPL